MKHYSFLVILVSFLLYSCSEQTLQKYDAVQLYQEVMTIPTYLTGEPERNPVFYTPENYQGAQRRVYPYPNIDKLTDERVDKKYTGLFLENEYLKLCVLPELGGRLYIAQDKTNEYHFIYYNQVIKPALIGMAGAWISGGVEWDMPHHHRVSTFMPVDYKPVVNPDGSKTIWVGEYEKRHHTKWMVGLTLHPGKAFVETEIKLFNASPFEQSALIWANPAVHVNEDYQVIFPPDVTKAVYHHKNEFTDWPVSRQFYRGIDFTSGVDISWWKNTASPTSFFVWETDYDFLGGIDHGKKAGTVFVGNRHIFPGKKMWNWGNNEIARVWDKMLTDEDGPYIEIMMGAFSDNQPDYSWYDPHNMRRGTMYIYPVKGLDGIKNASEDIALNMELDSSQADVQIYATGLYSGITAKLADGDNILWKEQFSIDPTIVMSREIPLPEEMVWSDLELTVMNDENNIMISYSPPVLAEEAHPEPYASPGDPSHFRNTEDIFLAGLRLEQFGNSNLDPDVYYQEVLERDPDNIMATTQVAVNRLKRFDYTGAEKLLCKVVSKITANHTSPSMGKPFYYLGLSLLRQERLEEAYEQLYKAAWYHRWASAAYYQLACLDSRKGDYLTALDHVNLSLESNMNNLEAWQLKSILLRKTSDVQAGNIIEQLLESDPMNFVAYYESVFYNNEKGLSELEVILRNEPDNYLELASRYQAAGLYHDAIRILSLAIESDDPGLRSSPMIRYYLGWNNFMTGNLEVMRNDFEKASGLPTDYCFPHGAVSETVLRIACMENPGDHRAMYYLGNLYCDHQPDRALELWMKAIEIEPAEAVYRRNAAFVLANIRDEMVEAVQLMEEAVLLDTLDVLYIEELDRYYEYLKKPVSFRLAVMQKQRETIEKSDGCMARYLNLLILNRRFEEALDILTERHFRSAEASDINLHVQWTDANILMGAGLLKAGKAEEAGERFHKAMEFPENLESARDSKIAVALYFLGKVYEKSGDRKQTKEYYQRLVDFESTTGWGAGTWPEGSYFKAKALGELGNSSQAGKIYRDLIRRGKSSVDYKPHPAWFLTSVQRRQQLVVRKANGYYMQALGYLGTGNTALANQMIRQALNLYPGHVGATFYYHLK